MAWTTLRLSWTNESPRTTVTFATRAISSSCKKVSYRRCAILLRECESHCLIGLPLGSLEMYAHVSRPEGKSATPCLSRGLSSADEDKVDRGCRCRAGNRKAFRTSPRERAFMRPASNQVPGLQGRPSHFDDPSTYSVWSARHTFVNATTHGTGWRASSAMKTVEKIGCVAFSQSTSARSQK